MSPDQDYGAPAADPYQHLPLLTAREALRRDVYSLEVPDGTEHMLCPGNREHGGRFFRTQIKAYSDLQTLGFIPRRLAEEKVRQAVAEDDRAVFDRVASCTPPPAASCGCGGGEGDAAISRTTPLRRAYNSARNSYHPALARLLSDHLGTVVEWDSPLAATTRRWLFAAKLRVTVIGVLLKDIVIHRNAQLNIAAAAKSLYAHDIFIHRTGRLVQQGSYLGVWANSILRFNDKFVSAELISVAKRSSAAWLLND